MDARQVFLLATHLASRETVRQFDRLRTETEGLGDSLILFHQAPKTTVPKSVVQRPHYVVDDDRLQRLGYYTSGPSLLPGRTHFPLVCFHQDHPHDFYWYIEYDVRFQGDWGDLFRFFHQAQEDLLTCHVRRHADEPGWWWWKTLGHDDENVPMEDRIRSFNTIYRISGGALGHVDRMHRGGWHGHEEVLIATLLHRGGFQLRDFGGEGDFVAPGSENRFYVDSSTPQLRDGTMRYRPPHSLLRRVPEGKLAHPVKPHRTTRAVTGWVAGAASRGARLTVSFPGRLWNRARRVWSRRAHS